MRALLPLFALSGCATQDVLRSEPIAERAVCNDGVGIFGRPHGIPACADEVVNLGDGCYAVREHGRRSLVECTARAPDGHVMCLVDPRGERALFDDRHVAVVSRVWVPDEPLGTVTQVGRCRERYRTWVAEAEPRLPPPELVVTGWTSYSGRTLGTPPDTRFTPEEDPVALDRIVPGGVGTARVCPGPEVELVFPDQLPARFAQRLRAAVGRAFVAAPVRACATVGFRLSPAPRPEATARLP